MIKKREAENEEIRKRSSGLKKTHKVPNLLLLLLKFSIYYMIPSSAWIPFHIKKYLHR